MPKQNKKKSYTEIGENVGKNIITSKPNPFKKKTKPVTQNKQAKHYLTPAKVVYTYPDTCINPIRENPLSSLFKESDNIKPVPKSTRKYHNRAAHPEFQDINLSAGYHSALMKQLEICEELQRAQIDVSIAGLPEATKEEMSKKHGKLI